MERTNEISKVGYIIEVSHGPYPRDRKSYWTGAAPGARAMAIIYESYEDACNASSDIQDYPQYICDRISKVSQEFSTQVIHDRENPSISIPFSEDSASI